MADPSGWQGVPHCARWTQSLSTIAKARSACPLISTAWRPAVPRHLQLQTVLGSSRHHKTKQSRCRYLARRALRLDQSRLAALKYVIAGLKHSPRGFALPVRRGVPTLLGALASPVLTRPLRQRLFAR